MATPIPVIYAAPNISQEDIEVIKAIIVQINAAFLGCGVL
jgi:hypothetical protein